MFTFAIEIFEFISGRTETRIIKAAETIRDNKINGSAGRCHYERKGKETQAENPGNRKAHQE